MIAASTIFVFRAREPNMLRPYRTWGYPVVPALFVVAAAVLLYYTFMEKLHRSPVGTMVMTLVILAGVPVYWYFAKRRKDAGVSNRAERSIFPMSKMTHGLSGTSRYNQARFFHFDANFQEPSACQGIRET